MYASSESDVSSDGFGRSRGVSRAGWDFPGGSPGSPPTGDADTSKARTSHAHLLRIMHMSDTTSIHETARLRPIQSSFFSSY
jgi:hypothetical protein